MGRLALAFSPPPTQPCPGAATRVAVFPEGVRDCLRLTPLTASTIVFLLGVFALSWKKIAAPPYHSLAASDLPPANLAAARPAPLKGFLTSPDWHSGGYQDPRHLNNPDLTLEFYYIGLSEVMESMTDFPGFDSVVEPRVAASASRGKHAILRFYMDYPRPEGKYVSHTPQFMIDDYGLSMTPWSSDILTAVGLSPDYADPNLVLALKNFIAALGSRYDGDPRVGFIQMGLLGFWGEWHTWTGDPATGGWIPDTTRMAVIDAYDAAFQTTQVQARYIHWYAVGRRGFGLHDDSFAHSTIDEGVYDQPMDWFFWSQVKKAGATDFWSLGPMGGELRPELQSTIFDDNYPAGTQQKQDFGMCSETTHATYMIDHYAAWPGYTGSALDRAKVASDHMGYAFRVTEVSVAEGAVAGEVDVTATIVQDGIAPFYYDLGVELSCSCFSASLRGVDDIVAKGSSASFKFTNVPATSACLSAVAFSLSSSYALSGAPIKFAQGASDGTTVEVSLPLPGHATPPPTRHPTRHPTPEPTPNPTGPATSQPTDNPAATVAKYICSKSCPEDADICSNGSLLDSTCQTHGASCGGGDRVCQVADCPSSGPAPPTHAPPPPSPPAR